MRNPPNAPKPCTICQGTFTPGHKSELTCSKECSQARAAFLNVAVMLRKKFGPVRLVLQVCLQAQDQRELRLTASSPRSLGEAVADA